MQKNLLITILICIVTGVTSHIIRTKILSMNWISLLPWLLAFVAVCITWLILTLIEFKKEINELKNELNNKVDKDKPLEKGHSIRLGM